MFQTICMLNLNTPPSNVRNVEINVGSSEGQSDILQLNIPYTKGTEVSLFSNDSKAMIHMGNLPVTTYYYSVRLKFKDGTYSTYQNSSSLAN